MAIYKSKQTVEGFSFHDIKKFAEKNTAFPHWAFVFKNLSFTHISDTEYGVVIPLKGSCFLTENDVILFKNKDVEILSKNKLQEQYVEL